MERTKTAVEWYDQQLNIIDLRLKSESITFGEYLEFRGNLYKEAKQMEKEQIMDAYNQGCNDYDELGYKKIEQYYNETYKNTGNE